MGQADPRVQSRRGAGFAAAAVSWETTLATRGRSSASTFFSFSLSHHFPLFPCHLNVFKVVGCCDVIESDTILQLYGGYELF